MRSVECVRWHEFCGMLSKLSEARNLDIEYSRYESLILSDDGLTLKYIEDLTVVKWFATIINELSLWCILRRPALG